MKKNLSVVTSLAVAGAIALVAALSAGGCGSDDPDLPKGNLTAGDGGKVSTEPQPAECGGTLCNDICVDLKKDHDSCGACSAGCGTSEVCVDGACSPSCGGGTTKCGNTCEDLASDPGNCGACGKACAPGEVCGDGKCGLVCATGLTKCGGGSDAGTDASGATWCADFARDSANCGGCGTKCSAGQVCTSAHCCAAGQGYCGGSCIDIAFDEANCGGCGTSCSGATPVCGSGTCIAIMASCKAIKTARPSARSGVYVIDPDDAAGPIAPFEAYCDMTTDGGGWTLIESTSGGLGPNGLSQGVVTTGSAAFMPSATMVALATAATQVHIRSTGKAATQSITSTASSAPIVNLRALKVVNDGITGTDQVSLWTGPLATEKTLAFDCATTATWPAVYWACGNSQGAHILGSASRWDWNEGDDRANTAIEVYVR